MIYAFTINDVQVGAIDMDDLLHNRVYGRLKMFDQAWEETSMVMKMELDVGLLEGFSNKTWQKSTCMKSALSLFHPHRVHRKEPRS